MYPFSAVFISISVFYVSTHPLIIGVWPSSRISISSGLAELDMILRNQILNAVYTWFSPIEDLQFSRNMVDANKEFHEKAARSGKFHVPGSVQIEAGVDVRGEQYIDYVFEPAEGGAQKTVISSAKEVPVKHKKGATSLKNNGR
jgi:hypothetical protein